ncbi:MAG: gamma-glutamyltransferase family protein [Candidatus Korarchaeota archaeon]|nr:gamma-glutamyltransferase family protein [Candidatus Korarchaeota archaeon]NIU85441.1 gamma-glutamyltransferase [Candidatus Thorarchaeota archaeon]NIW15553.1 gamma-glutamyltransferase [Candidatus Thorarchaeota archaeon]NIW53494.1 gamma-glutamyltransferase [Candidatus Korarchaeota archaeon]
MNWDPLEYPYPSRRRVIYAKKGMIATSQPLAAQAGLEILKKGGNAIDAAIASAAALTVLEPTSNGIGGDAFALLWHGGDLHGLNSSGPAPSAISIETLNEEGYDEMPKVGWGPVTVPGVPAAWATLSDRFGELPLTEILKPAVEYAEEGYPLSPILGKSWKHAYEYYKKQEGEQFKHWFETFAPNGRPPEIGEVWKSPDHAETLRSIAETKSRAFYEGKLAEKIDEFSKEYDGYLTKADLAAFQPEWVNPIKVTYRGYDVWELPPNGQGLIALMALNILKGFEFECKDTVKAYHRQIEALKLAFADGKEFITDPEFMKVKVRELLSESYAETRRALIGKEALKPRPGKPTEGETVYLATADKNGNMVSYIQSNYMGFGSGLVVPETGIALQNRGHLFSLDPSDANVLKPGKRTYHTIIPGFLTTNDKPVGPFGVMGGYMQPQGHLQVIMNMIDFNLNPQAALDAPRWRWTDSKHVVVEHSFPKYLAKALTSRGHNIRYALHSGGFGRGQIIWKDNNVFAGGSEPRTDGQIAAW